MWSIVISMSVCLSAGIYHKVYIKISPNFLYMLLLAVARSSFDGNAISHVLPVLWMTSCLHIIQRTGHSWRRCVCFVQFARWRQRGRSLPSPTSSCWKMCSKQAGLQIRGRYAEWTAELIETRYGALACSFVHGRTSQSCFLSMMDFCHWVKCGPYGW